MRLDLPGAPFHGDGLQKGPGVALGWFQDMEMTLVWPKEKGHHTSEYIDDLGWKMSISESGRASMLSLVDMWGPNLLADAPLYCTLIRRAKRSSD